MLPYGHICIVRTALTNWCLVPHTCLSEPGRQWCRLWLDACWAPSDYLIQRWLTVSSLCIKIYLDTINNTIQILDFNKMLLKVKWMSFLFRSRCDTLTYTRSGNGDVIKWEHFPRYWLFVRGIQRSLVNSPHKGQWRGALFSWICVWLNGWVNSREASLENGFASDICLCEHTAAEAIFGVNISLRYTRITDRGR